MWCLSQHQAFMQPACGLGASTSGRSHASSSPRQPCQQSVSSQSTNGSTVHPGRSRRVATHAAGNSSTPVVVAVSAAQPAVQSQAGPAVSQSSVRGSAASYRSAEPATTAVAVEVVDLDAATRARREIRRQRLEASVQAEQQQLASQQEGGLPLGLVLGIGALTGAGILFVLYRQFFANSAKQAVNKTVAAVTEGVQQKRLQKDAQGRLDEFSDQLRNQSAVDLSAKNLGDEGTAYVVEALAFNSSCRAIDLSKNGIGKMGVAALCQVLTTAGLQKLVLNTNSVGDEGAELLAKVVAGSNLLTNVDLGQNGIGDKGARSIAEALKLNTSITKLDLSGNAIDVDGATALAGALKVNATLEVLILNDNYISEKGALALADALRGNTSLKELHVKGNGMEDAGVKALCDALTARDSELRCLDMGNNSISDVGAASISALLLAKPQFKELNLYMNDVGNSGMIKLAPAIKDNKALKVLDLGGNNIGPEGAKLLAEAITGHQALRTLELGYNPLGPEGLKPVVDAVKFNLKVEALKLGWCKIGSNDGARTLADLLMFNTTLTSLDLRGNSLGNDGAIILSRGIKEQESKKLGELDLGYNEIKDDGACSIAQALKANPDAAPKELKLNSNYITRFGQVALSEAVDMVYEMGGGKITTVHF